MDSFSIRNDVQYCWTERKQHGRCVNFDCKSVDRFGDKIDEFTPVEKKAFELMSIPRSKYANIFWGSMTRQRDSHVSLAQAAILLVHHAKWDPPPSIVAPLSTFAKQTFFSSANCRSLAVVSPRKRIFLATFWSIIIDRSRRSSFITNLVISLQK